MTKEEGIDVTFKLDRLRVWISWSLWLSSSANELSAKHLSLITEPSLRALLDQAGRIAFATSYQIMLARHEKHWPKCNSLLAWQ